MRDKDLMTIAVVTVTPEARLADVAHQPWANAHLVFPSVEDGVVTFHGWCRSSDVSRALRVLAEALPGVKGVQMQLREPPGFLMGVP